MNKQLLIISIAAILAAPSAFAAYTTGAATDGTDADDKQTVTVTVPEIALLNVSATPVDFDETGLVAPTTAGTGFTGSATAATSYDISSNVANTASPTKRTITVSVDPTVGKVPEGASLAIAVTAPTGGSDGTATLTNTTTSAQTSATSIANTKGSALPIAYTLVADASGMIAHTGTDGTAADNIGLIYTLSND
jgi:hypothetical protein